METVFFTQQQIQQVANLLNEGEIVAIPTDTVYGLAVIADNQAAINHLREVKHRPDEKALAYMVNSLAMIEAVCELTDRDRDLIKRLLPGPLTLIFNKKKTISIVDESGLDTLAVRIPDHPFILELINYTRKGLYVPSANPSTMAAAINSDEVAGYFLGQISGIVEGSAYQGMASTIVDCTKTELKILRQGPISLQEIENER